MEVDSRDMTTNLVVCMKFLLLICGSVAKIYDRSCIKILSMIRLIKDMIIV